MPESPEMIAVVDVGKTNLKLLIATAGGELVAHISRVNDFTATNPYPLIDTGAIMDWLLSALRELAKRHKIAAIIATTHGCTGTLCDEAGDVLPMMDYEAPAPDWLDADYAKIAPPYSEVMTTNGPGVMRGARQLLWQARAFPDEFGRAKYFLAFPQYIAWRLGGRRATEISHLAAQSHLWAPLQRDFSSIVKNQGWQKLFPPFAKAGEVLGTISPAIAAQTGIAQTCQILCGVHDSNANLFRYKAAGLADGTLLSTGTWMIGFERTRDLATLDAMRNMVSNVDVDGAPIASTLTMAGREYASIVGDAPQVPDAEVIAAARTLIARGTFALPSFGDDAGLFPGSAKRGRIVGPKPENAAQRRALGALYVAFTASACLDALGSQRQPIIIDGGFAANKPFAQMLASLRPGQTVHVSHSRDGTALGAALLWKQTERKEPVMSVKLQAMEAADLPGLTEAAQQWARLSI